MITVARSTNLYPGIKWITPIVGKAPYWLWRDGIIPDGPGAYAVNERIPRGLRRTILSRGLFCAAVPNLMRRKAGKVIPTRGYPEYDGGIASYFTGVFGPGFFTKYEQPFDAQTALEWAQASRSGVLLGKGYWGEEIHRQGHVGILLPSGYILQSVFGEGLHWYRTVWQEAAYWGGGGVMVAPWDWIEHDLGRAPWAEPFTGRHRAF
jgi:hypothetical protein